MTTPPLGRRPYGRLAAWLALAAMLWHAVVPVYAMAAMGDQDAERVPICTPDGLVWFDLDDEGQPVEPVQKSQKPCHFCLSQATPFAPAQFVAVANDSRPSEHLRYVPEGQPVLSNPSTKTPSIRAPPPPSIA
ncbi:MAG: hypothetical protein OEM93_12140 [Rhodospirillales bacterium]|nr:hypothetical protein [Rhodospirillales bacterium]